MARLASRNGSSPAGMVTIWEVSASRSLAVATLLWKKFSHLVDEYGCNDRLSDEVLRHARQRVAWDLEVNVTRDEEKARSRLSFVEEVSESQSSHLLGQNKVNDHEMKLVAL